MNCLLIKLVIKLLFLFWHVFFVSHCRTSLESLLFPYSSHSCCVSEIFSLSFYHFTDFSVIYGHPVFPSFGEGFLWTCVCIYLYRYLWRGMCMDRTGIKVSPCKTSLETDLAENGFLSTNLFETFSSLVLLLTTLWYLLLPIEGSRCVDV